MGGRVLCMERGGEDDNIESWLQNPKVLRPVNEARQDCRFLGAGGVGG